MDNLTIAALQTARAGSKSVPNKNLIMYKGMPLFKHNLIHCLGSKYLYNIYVSTDSKEIIKECKSTRNTLPYPLGFNPTNCFSIIKRPAYLCKDDSSHYDTIIHGLKHIEKDMGKQVDIFVVLLGNNTHAYPKDLDAALDRFIDNFERFDSCQSVAKFNMFNPYRAFKINSNNGLTPFVEIIRKVKRSNDKNAFGNTYFFTGSFWIIKRSTLIKNDGDSVFSWLGQRIMPYEQNPQYQEIDDNWQLKLL